MLLTLEILARRLPQFSAWLCHDLYIRAKKRDAEGDKGRDCMKVVLVVLCGGLYLLFAGLALLSLFLQYAAVELVAGLAAFFGICCACSGGHLAWCFHRVRGVGHRTREALDKRCRPKKEGGLDAAAGGTADMPRTDNETHQPSWTINQATSAGSVSASGGSSGGGSGSSGGMSWGASSGSVATPAADAAPSCVSADPAAAPAWAVAEPVVPGA